MGKAARGRRRHAGRLRAPTSTRPIVARAPRRSRSPIRTPSCGGATHAPGLRPVRLPAHARPTRSRSRRWSTRSPARRTHADLRAGEATRVQHAFAYSDGFGREIQQQGPGRAGPARAGRHRRRPALGRQRLDDLQQQGQAGPAVRAVLQRHAPLRVRPRRSASARSLCYDPLGRVVATLHPNHTWEKVVFDAWRQESWDVNDTRPARPRRRPRRRRPRPRGCPTADYLPTWHAQRAGGALGAARAGRRRRRPPCTPARPTSRTSTRSAAPFLTVAHNRFDARPRRSRSTYAHARRARHRGQPARGRRRARTASSMRYDYDLLGSRIHSASMEAGERWTLADVGRQADPRLGQPRPPPSAPSYDALRRPADVVRCATGDRRSEQLRRADRVRREPRPTPAARNLRGRVVPGRSTAPACVTTDELRLQGQPAAASSRRLAGDYTARAGLVGRRSPLDATERFTEPHALRRAQPAGRAATHAGRQRASGRPTTRPACSRRVEVEPARRDRGDRRRRSSTDIDYDAKGQRDADRATATASRTDLRLRPADLPARPGCGPRRGAERGCRTCATPTTRSATSPTSRTTRSRRSSSATGRVEPSADYTYDAALPAGRGRPAASTSARSAPAPTAGRDRRAARGLPHPGDGDAMGRYTRALRLRRRSATSSSCSTPAATRRIPAGPATTPTTSRACSSPAGEQPAQRDARSATAHVEPYALRRARQHDRDAAPAGDALGPPRPARTPPARQVVTDGDAGDDVLRLRRRRAAGPQGHRAPGRRTARRRRA